MFLFFLKTSYFYWNLLCTQTDCKNSHYCRINSFFRSEYKICSGPWKKLHTWLQNCIKLKLKKYYKLLLLKINSEQSLNRVLLPKTIMGWEKLLVRKMLLNIFITFENSKTTWYLLPIVIHVVLNVYYTGEIVFFIFQSTIFWKKFVTENRLVLGNCRYFFTAKHCLQKKKKNSEDIIP